MNRRAELRDNDGRKRGELVLTSNRDFSLVVPHEDGLGQTEYAFRGRLTDDGSEIWTPQE